MAKVAAIKSAWIVLGVVLIVQVMDSCENVLCKGATLLAGVLIVAAGSWLIVKKHSK